MKYLKKFESNIEETMAKKVIDYKKYYDKYVILEYKQDFYLAKFIEINVFNRVILEIYYWNSGISDFSIKSTDILTINEIYVLSSYDKLADAKKSYRVILDTNKFNL